MGTRGSILISARLTVRHCWFLTRKLGGAGDHLFQFAVNVFVADMLVFEDTVA
jgi:hypothetical protein